MSWLHHKNLHCSRHITVTSWWVRAMASEITSLTIVCSNVYSGTDQRKHESSIWKFLFHDVIMWIIVWLDSLKPINWFMCRSPTLFGTIWSWRKYFRDCCTQLGTEPLILTLKCSSWLIFITGIACIFIVPVRSGTKNWQVCICRRLPMFYYISIWEHTTMK